MLRRHEIGRRLEGLERAKAAEDDMPLYLLNYGGDSPRLRAHDGRLWACGAEESRDDFMERIKAAYPPRGFLILHPERGAT